MQDQPIYVRGAYFLLFILLLIMTLYLGQALWITLIAATILSFLMLPIVRRLERAYLPRWLASLFGVFFVVAVVGSLVYFVGSQLLGLIDDLPKLQASIEQKSEKMYEYVADRAHISPKEQSAWIDEKKKELLGSGTTSLLSIFRATGAALASMVLIPVIMFFMLIYREKFNVFLQAFCGTHYDNVMTVAVKISKISQRYIRGLALDIAILTCLNAIGFLALDLEYALLFAFLAALLNIIPYVGVLIGSALPVAMALLTKDSPFVAVAVLGVCVVVQFIDNNFITPKVVGSSVNINPLASIVALVLGGMIWGLAGMLLSIPLAGMFKVICDHVESLRPYGYLLGEEKTYLHKPIYQRLVLPDFMRRALHAK
jgi:predicted PurR-regulated permease PerM